MNSRIFLCILILIFFTALSHGDTEKIYSWDMNENPNWIMNGEWEWGVPLGQGGISFGLPDPYGGHTGSNVIGINNSGDYSIKKIGGPYYLRTQAINCSGICDAELRFHRWLNIDWQPWVSSYIHVSNDAINWIELWTNGSTGEIVENVWSEFTYDISDIADGESAVFIRWSYSIDTPDAWAYSGWNIDDVSIWGTKETQCSSKCAEDFNNDNFINTGDLLLMISAFGSNDSDFDLNNDYLVNTIDLLALISSYGPCQTP